MECLKSNIKYKGVIIDMNNRNSQEDNQENNRGIISRLFTDYRTWNIVEKIIIPVIVALIPIFLVWMARTIISTDNKLATSQVKLDNLNENIKELNDSIDEINEILNIQSSPSKSGLITRISVLETILSNEGKILSASNDMTNSVNEISTIEPNNSNLVTSSLNGNTIIGTDADGNTYIAENLIGETILLTYTEDNEEVFFLGQYNENYNWDGYCVTNSYSSSGHLIGVCESNFDNGKRLNYKSLFDGEDSWLYSDRTCSESTNIGINKTYNLDYDRIKNFTDTNVRISDMIFVDNFIEENNPTLKTYYHGDTTDSLYNDQSGNAYYVSYFDDGTVKTLYQGDFKDGEFDDSTGNAWYIVKDVDTSYMYFKGFFKHSSAIEDETHKYENPIDLTRIEEILKDKKFDCELKWAEN